MSAYGETGLRISMSAYGETEPGLREFAYPTQVGGRSRGRGCLCLRLEGVAVCVYVEQFA